MRAAIFDMDGLLVDSEPLWREAEIEVFRRVGMELDDDMCRRTMGLRTNEVIAYWYNLHPWTGMTQAELETALIDRVQELIREKATALPGVEGCLDFFKKRNFQIALASSSPMRLIETVVDSLNIRHHFDVIQSAEPLPLGKPHPEVFLETARLLDVPAMECLVFEDSVAGLIAALAAKMKTVAVPDEENQNDPRYSIAHVRLNSLTAWTEEVFARFQPDTL